MGIDIIKGNLEAKRLIRNELKKNKSSGTYLFYGRKGADLFEFALAFTKGINCLEAEYDYCDNCRTCKNIDKKIYSDLHILSAMEGNVKIDQIREVIRNASESSYEGGNKVFIIEGVNRLRKEAANALLKIIEEPPVNTYFILLANTLNILPTIKSRTMAIEIKCLTHDELEVEREVYDYFIGNVKDIKTCRDMNIDINKEVKYEELPEIIEGYLEEGLFEDKVRIIAGIEDYVKNKDYTDDIDKIKFAEDLDRIIGKNREFLKELIYLFIVKAKAGRNLEDLLTLKESISYNVNTNITLVNTMLEL